MFVGWSSSLLGAGGDGDEGCRLAGGKSAVCRSWKKDISVMGDANTKAL